jgi:hypothetical protein
MIFPILFYSFIAFVLYKLICRALFFISKNNNVKSKNIKLLAFIISVSIPISLIAYREINTPDIEWNPLIKDEKVVIGNWRGENELLVLNTDHTFTLKVNQQEFSGRWSLDDWNLTFDYQYTATPYNYLRVIFHSNSYHLVKGTLDKDPDVWDYKNELVKQ